MISSQELTELSTFFSDDNDAFSLYFEPHTSQDLSHRVEYINLKERIQQTIGNLHAIPSGSRAMVERALERVAEMEGNRGLSKVIFGCPRQNFWREYDLPGKFGTRAAMGQTFVIAPLLTQQENQARFGILLADRNRTRVLLLQGREISEISHDEREDQEKFRTTGTGRSAHLERSKEEPVRRHFRAVGEQLFRMHQQGRFDALLVGCREELWPEIEGEFPSELRRATLGHFTVDPGLATLNEVQSKAEQMIVQHDDDELNHLAARAANAEAASGLGAVGLTDVGEALEREEVRTLLWPDPRGLFAEGASLCPNCGHLDLKMGNRCALCSSEMLRFERADEALLRKALRGGVEIRVLRNASAHPEDQISALLRFKADRNSPQALAS